MVRQHSQHHEVLETRKGALITLQADELVLLYNVDHLLLAVLRCCEHGTLLGAV